MERTIVRTRDELNLFHVHFLSFYDSSKILDWYYQVYNSVLSQLMKCQSFSLRSIRFYPPSLSFTYPFYTMQELLNFNYLTRVSIRSNFSRINVIKADSVMSRKKKKKRKRKKSTFTSYFVFCLCSLYIFFFYSFFPFSFLSSLLFVFLSFFLFRCVTRKRFDGKTYLPS